MKIQRGRRIKKFKMNFIFKMKILPLAGLKQLIPNSR